MTLTHLLRLFISSPGTSIGNIKLTPQDGKFYRIVRVLVSRRSLSFCRWVGGSALSVVCAADSMP